jgi:hypothetical protein
MWTIMARDAKAGPDALQILYGVAHTEEEVLRPMKKAQDEGLLAMSLPPLTHLS